MRGLDDLDTIQRLIDRIEETVARETAESFKASSDAADAVAYRLSMIGEHCKRLPETIRARHPEVPWRAMVGLRNIVVHGYDNLSPAIIWQTATQELTVVQRMAIDERERLAHERGPQDLGHGL
jgi:uncharacterized protein with HEPN domain